MKNMIIIISLLILIAGCVEQFSEGPSQIPTQEPEIEQLLEEEIPGDVNDTTTGEPTGEPQVNEPTGEPQVTEPTGEPPVTEPIGEPPVTEPTGEPQVNESTGEPQQEIEIETELELIYPELTYPDAYNGPLYATSEQVGNNALTDQYWKNLDRNGVNYLIAFFTIYGEPSEDTLMSSRNLGYVLDWVEKHPYRVIPFFNPGFGGDEVEPLVGDKLTSMYGGSLQASKKIVGNDFIKGFGELETHMWDMRHNDPKFMQIVRLASDNNLFVMFHPVSEKINDVTAIIEEYPDTTFLIHMYREDLLEIRDELIDIMETHDNLYFSIDVAHILYYEGHDIIYTYNDLDRDKAKNRFISTFDSEYTGILDGAVRDYKPFVDAVPDKVMWGTESGPLFNWEPEVYDRMIKISRLFIGKLDKEHQEAVGYKNALRVFGEGVELTQKIGVVDASSWSTCTSSQRSRREERCETTDYSVKVEACRERLLIQQKCIEEMEEPIDAGDEGDTGDEGDEFCVPFDGDEMECLSHSDKCEWSTDEGGICLDK